LTDRWGVFAEVAGGATAALLGLLFVAVSIRVVVIAGSVELRNRAAQTGVLFLSGLLASLLLVIPEQARWLGVEFLVLASATGVTILALGRKADLKPTGSRTARLLDVSTPNSTTCLLLAAAGLILLLGQGWGLYVVATAVIVVLVGGAASAWLLLLNLTE
jgi:hypothetical protein